MTDDICGYPTAEDTPCQHDPTEDDGYCWQHTEQGERKPGGPPAAFDDPDTRQRVLVAVGQGLKVEHQAGLAGVSSNTLRRALCCIESPRNPDLDEDPCGFCSNYAQAHANGAREVLQDCRPEFVASASFGYNKKEERDHEMSGDLGISSVFMGTDDTDS